MLACLYVAQGFEWPIFNSWPELSDEASRDYVLPMQMLVEVHYQSQFKELWLPGQKSGFEDNKFPEDLVHLQKKLLQMGYVTAIRDDNQACKHCTELSLIRFACYE